MQDTHRLHELCEMRADHYVAQVADVQGRVGVRAGVLDDHLLALV